MSENELRPCPFTFITAKTGESIIVDTEDLSFLKQYEWSVYDRYAETYRDNKTIRLHRLLLNVTDSSVHVDHKNGNPLDNRKSNIRVCNRYQNQQNRKTNVNNKLGAKGVVRLSSGHYRVRVQSFGIRRDLGVFATLEEAKNERERYARSKHGEFFR